MSEEPYARGIVPERPFVAVAAMEGHFVAVLGVRFTDRNLELETVRARAFPDGSIAECCVTDEPHATPGKVVARAAYLGFIRFARGGVIATGMECRIGEEVVGEVVGFDGVHAPNHWTIVVRSGWFADGGERGIQTGQTVTFQYR
ncbi:MAG: hypothetical protein RMK01_08795 [Thermomicrobium sp.]|nr:hypothetical protein [Thermomicrobium sp.]